ncbi:MAG: gliding motility-associated C-terminal domain-containing protein [Bacteroidetes bacterium]|nr:gliding motility-associated C-terminal domain-containing protein [Bacteroidota bacterium]
MNLGKSLLLLVINLIAFFANSQSILKKWDIAIGSTQESAFIQYAFNIVSDSILLVISFSGDDTLVNGTDSLKLDSIGGKDIALVWANKNGKFLKSKTLGGNQDDIIIDFISDNNSYWLLMSSNSNGGMLDVMSTDSAGYFPSQNVLVNISKSGSVLNSKTFKFGNVGAFPKSFIKFNSDTLIICDEPTKFYKSIVKRQQRIFAYCISLDSIVWNNLLSEKSTFTHPGRVGKIGNQIVKGDDIHSWKILNPSSGFIELDTIYPCNQNRFGSLFCQNSTNSSLFLTINAFNKNGIKTEDTRGQWDYWLVNLDESGNVLWDKTLGGNFDDGFGSIDNGIYRQAEQSYNLIQLDDNSIIISGFSKSNRFGDKSENRRGGFDFWTLLLDSMGNLLCDKTFGSKEDDIAHGLLQIGENSYLSWGYSEGGVQKDRTAKAQNSKVDNWLVGFCIAPPNELNIVNDTNLCQGDSMTLKAAKGYRYLWSTGDTLDQINISQTDSYFVQIIGKNNCISYSDTFYIEFWPYPKGTIKTSTGTTIFCNPDSIKLMVPNGYKSYYWSNGDTNSFIWTKRAGTYFIDIESFPYCFSRIDSITIESKNKPKAKFGVKELTYLCDSVLLLISDSSENAKKISIDFGDGKKPTSSLSNTYYASGNYSIKQKVTNSVCSDSFSYELVIDFGKTIISTIQINDTIFCAPDTAYFIFKSDTSIKSTWLKINDTLLVKKESPFLLISQGGKFKVEQRILSSNGCESVDSLVFKAYEKPNSIFSLIDIDTLCDTLKFIFNNKSEPHDISFGKGKYSLIENGITIASFTSQSDTFSYTANKNGIVNFSLGYNIGACQDSSSLDLIVNIPEFPEAKLQASSDGLCIGDSILIVNSSFHSTSHSYYLNRHHFDLEKMGMYFKIDSIGKFGIQLNAKNDFGCIDSLKIPLNIKVLNRPVATISLTNKNSLCSPAYFKAYSAGNGASFNYKWRLNPENLDFNGEEIEFILKFPQDSLSVLELKLFNDYCADSISEQIRVLESPNSDFWISDSAFCLPKAVKFENRSSRADSFFWEVNNVKLHQIDLFSKMFDSSGIYKIGIYSMLKNGCKDSLVKVNGIRVFDLPSAQFTIEHASGCSPIDLVIDIEKESQFGFNYFWKIDGRDSFSISSDFSFLLNGNSNTNRNLELLVRNDFCSDSFQRNVHFNGISTKVKPSLLNATVEIDSVIYLKWVSVENAFQYLIQTFENEKWVSLDVTQDSFYYHRPVDYNKNYLYRISAQDSCDNISLYSNEGTIIKLIANEGVNNQYILLNWDEYKDWDSGVKLYYVQQWNESTFISIDSTSQNNLLLESKRILNIDFLLFRILAVSQDQKYKSASWPTLFAPGNMDFIIPTGFSPNDDSVNDQLEIYSINKDSFIVQIFNKWGELVFTGNEQVFWNGQYLNEKVPIGNYLIIVSNENFVKSQIITLIR